MKNTTVVSFDFWVRSGYLGIFEYWLIKDSKKHSKMFVIDDLVCFQISQYLGCYIQSVNGNMLISAGCQKEVYIEV